MMGPADSSRTHHALDRVRDVRPPRLYTFATARPPCKHGGSAPSGFCVFQAEAVAPALDMADRGRREVHRAAQRVGVAVALEEIPARPDSLVAVGVDAHDPFGIAGLDRRMDQIAGEHRGVAALAGAD